MAGLSLLLAQRALEVLDRDGPVALRQVDVFPVRYLQLADAAQRAQADPEWGARGREFENPATLTKNAMGPEFHDSGLFVFFAKKWRLLKINDLLWLTSRIGCPE